MIRGSVKAAVATVVAAAVALASSTAAAQRGETGAGLDAPRLPGEPPVEPDERKPDERKPDERKPDERKPDAADEGDDIVGPDGWRGPRMELFYSLYALAERKQDGRVHAGGFGGWLPTGDFRFGGHGEVGVRRYGLGPDDLVLRGTVVAGYQHRTDRVAPYIGVAGTVGMVFGKRFHTPVQHGLFGAGFEAGLDLRLAGPVWSGLSFSWIRASMRDVHQDMLIMRLRLGL